MTEDDVNANASEVSGQSPPAVPKHRYVAMLHDATEIWLILILRYMHVQGGPSALGKMLTPKLKLRLAVNL